MATGKSPAFYALAGAKGWQDYLNLLHAPYTLWHLSYVVLGAAISPTVHLDRLLGTLLAFFLAVGIAAHALDELNDRNFEIPVIRQREFQLRNRESSDYINKLYGGNWDGARAEPHFTWEMLLERSMLAGPPEHVVQQIQELRDVCGIENVITFMDAGGVPHDKIMRSLELFGTQVMPAFAGA